MNTKNFKTCKHTILVKTAFVLFLATASLTAWAQGYTINGQPADPNVTGYLMMQNLPFGNYWLNDQGYWGVAGNPTPIGNIYSNSEPSIVYPSNPQYASPLARDRNKCFYYNGYSPNC